MSSPLSLSRVLITPINKDPRRPSNIDYKEQCESPLEWCWDDRAKNDAEVGQLFAFVQNRSKGTKGWVRVFRVRETLPPRHRLPSWHKNVGQGDRQVVMLGEQCLCELSWDEWLANDGHKKVQSTTHVKSRQLVRYMESQIRNSD